MPELAIQPLETAQVQTATDQVFQALYQAVVSLKLPPGTKVSEAEIAKQLDVSRQPVRDAFFRLSKLGFVSIRPQRATLVTKISERAVLDAYFIRTAIEVECLRVAISQISEADLLRLRANVAHQANTMTEADPGAFHASDEEFHAMICEIAGQPHAWALIQEQKAHMDRVRWLTLSMERRKSVLDEHTGIVRALEARDAAEAERLLRLHLGDIQYAIVRIREAHRAYFDDPS